MAAVLACLLLLGSAAGSGVALYAQAVSLIDGVDQSTRLGAEAAEASTLRDGPGGLYDPVTSVWEGESLRYLDSMEGWVRVETPSGRRGWLQGGLLSLWDSDTGAAYAVSPGVWRMTAPDGAGGGAPGGSARVERVSLAATAPGVLTLTVTGRGLEQPAVKSDPSRVLVGLTADWQGRLKVAAGGIETLSVSKDGVVLVTTGAAPAAEVIGQTDDRLVAELRPRVEAITPYLRDSSEIYHIALAGAPHPATWTGDDGHTVFLRLPGARLGNLALPDGVTAGQDEAGVTLRFASARQYAVRPAPGGLEMVLYAPGLAGKVIVLDPGHGGSETGAISPHTGMAEKTVNLDVARRLGELLEARGARVIMTRTGDTLVIPDAVWAQVDRRENPVRADLHERVRIAGAAGADLLLSVHHNAGEGRGAEMYFARESLNAERSETLAHMLQAEFVEQLGRRDRGAQHEMFYVTRFPTMPAVLTEGGFLTDVDEAWLLASPEYRQREAESMAAVVERYFQDRHPYDGPSASDLEPLLQDTPNSRQRYAAYLEAEVAQGLHRDYDLFVLGSKASVGRRPIVQEGQALADGRPVELGATPALEQGEFMVPVRLVAEHLGYAVTWLDRFRTIVITDGPLRE
jgi:N-acetylmuramoyl-L-alanine amidase